MKELAKQIESIVKELEDIQASVGGVQKELIDRLMSAETDEFDDEIQKSLVILERVQCTVGDAQLVLQPSHAEIRVTASGSPTSPMATQPSAPRPSTNIRIEDWTNPREWLDAHEIEILSVGKLALLDTPTGHLAWMLGNKFDVLFDFYRILKRHASGGQAPFHFAIGGFDSPGASVVLEFATALKNKGFLAEFHPDKKTREIYFKPQNISEIQNFLTGGWLEQYALLLVKQCADTLYGFWEEKYALLNTRVAFRDGKQSELDLLVGLPHQQILWLECKTGEWSNYAKSYRIRKQDYLKLPQNQAALLLLDPDADLNSASNLTQMTALRLPDLQNWITLQMQTK